MPDTAQVDDAVPGNAQEPPPTRPGRLPLPADEFSVPLLRGVTLRLRVLPTAWLLIAVHLILTATRLSRAWWWQDDLNLLAIADHHLGSALTAYSGHFQPGTFALAWLIDEIGPLAWWAAAPVTLLLVAACDLALLALLRRMFGTRPGVLVPLGLFCATTLPLMATMWWAAAMQWLPAMLALIVAMYGHVGYLSTGHRRDALVALVAIAGGLLFFEKPVTVVAVLAAYAVLYGSRARWFARPFRVLLRNPGYWLLQALLAGGFAAFYLTRVASTPPDTRAVTFGDHVRLVRYMLLDSYLTSLFGGPFRWRPGSANPFPLPSTGVVVVAAVLAVIVVVATVRARHRAVRAWLLLAGFLALSVMLVARSRIGLVGPIIGRDTRYLTDAAAMTAICLGLALMPLLPGLDRGLPPDDGPRRPRPRRSGGLRLQPGVLPVLASLAVLAITVAGAVSGERYVDRAEANPTKPYFAHLTAALAAAREANRPVNLFTDEVVPATVMEPTFEQARTLQNVTRPLRDRPRFAAWSPTISTVTADGRIVPATVEGAPVTPTSQLCSKRTGQIVIRTPGRVIQWRWKLHLGYLAQGATAARVRIGTAAPVEFRFAKGLGNVYLDVSSTSSRIIVIDGIDKATNVCLGSYTLGQRLRPA